MNRGAQMKLSFGMIFSIILIVIFLIFAFYVIKNLIKTQESLKEKQFIDDLESDVNTIWMEEEATKEVEYVLPKKIEEICFRNLGEENLYLMVKEDFPIRKKIDNLKITEIKCFKKIDSKVTFFLEKKFEEILVSVRA